MINGCYNKNLQFHQDDHWRKKKTLKSWNMSHKTQNRYPQSLAEPDLNEAFDSSWIQEVENNWGAETLSCVCAHGQEPVDNPGMCTWEHPPAGGAQTSWGQLLIMKLLFLAQHLFYLMLSSTCQEQSTGWILESDSAQVKNQCREKHLGNAQGLQGQRHCHSSQDTEHRKVQTVSKPLLPYFFFSTPGIFKLICLASSRCHTKSWHMVHGTESIIWLLLFLLK